jgi:hypothetical protein
MNNFVENPRKGSKINLCPMNKNHPQKSMPWPQSMTENFGAVGKLNTVVNNNGRLDVVGNCDGKFQGSGKNGHGGKV